METSTASFGSTHIGEAVLLGVDGQFDFNGLHSREHDAEVEFYAFDMLVSDGEDLRKLPLSMRKTNLARLLARRVDGVHLAPFEQGEIGPELFRHACLMGLGRRPLLQAGTTDVPPVQPGTLPTPKRISGAWPRTAKRLRLRTSGAEVGNEAARIHRGDRRRCGVVAACSTCAAIGDAGNRISQHSVTRGLQALSHCVSRGPQRSRLCRGPKSQR